MIYSHHTKLVLAFLLGLLLFLMQYTIPAARADGLIQLEPKNAENFSYTYLSPTTGESLTATPIIFNKDDDGAVSEPRPINAQVLASLNAGGAQGYTIGLGVWIGPSTFDERDLYSKETLEGAIIELEPGVGGIKIHTGYGSLKNEKLFFAIPLLAAWDIKASYYHTWSKLNQINAGENYIGATADFMLSFVKLSMGVYYQVLGSETAPQVFFDGSIGLVFPF